MYTLQHAHNHTHVHTPQGYAVNDLKRPHVYAWEIVVTMRKVSVMCVAVYFYESPPVQGIYSVSVCVCVCVCVL
jgi:hypothetical protein